MPKKNKKPGKNGYWEFVLECRSKNLNVNSQEELQTYASRKWAVMSKQEKEPYEQRAQLARNSYNPNRLTTDGEDIEELQRAAREAEAQVKDMKNHIMGTLKEASIDKKLGEEIFLLIHINHLVYAPKEDKYYIAEVAISAMTLANGLEDVFHEIVYPGSLPLGFSGPALAHSKETHQLYELVIGNSQNNTRDVYGKMVDFIKKYTSQGPAIVYADEKILEMTTKVLERFQEDFNSRYEINVYNLQYLFFALRNAAAGKNVWPNETYSHSELSKDMYSYTSDIACEFHDTADVPLYCSKAIAIRYIYTICDHCCADLNIQLVAGFHVPSKSKVKAETSSAFTSKAPSVCSNDEYRSRPPSRSDTSFASAAAYDNNYPPLSSGRSTASSVRSFSSMQAGPSASAAMRLKQSFKEFSIKQVTNQNQSRDLKFPERGPQKR